MTAGYLAAWWMGMLPDNHAEIPKEMIVIPHRSITAYPLTGTCCCR